MSLKRLTPEQEAAFDGYMRKWQEKLGLMGWRVERGTFATTALASVSTNYGARLATYVTGKWSNATPADLEATAAHELLHVLLADLLHQTAAKADPEVLESAEHVVVNTLEKLLMRTA